MCQKALLRSSYLLDVVVRASGSLGQGRVDNLVVYFGLSRFSQNPADCRLKALSNIVLSLLLIFRSIDSCD